MYERNEVMHLERVCVCVFERERVLTSPTVNK